MPTQTSVGPERTRKPRPVHAPYKTRTSKADAKQTNLSLTPLSAQDGTLHRSNLKLYQWLDVFAYVDAHPEASQDAIVEHFKSCSEGPRFIFNQSTLSRNLRPERRKAIEARVNEFPNALESKRPRIVTRPDVDRALFLWVKHMEEKKESVNGAMLIAKRAQFEEHFNVPDEERLKGDHWLDSFKKAYGIREHRRHGEAASVDLNVVEVERIRLKEILSKYSPKDRFNFDETSFFPFAPPDRGLATKQMSGKKQDKFRITMGLACNADGTEKLPIFFIGKFAKPRCFKNAPPKSLGLDYHNNTKAWMTGALFEEWLKSFDGKMRQQNRHICLLVDNFSGHFVDYHPHNIHIEYFEPNLTSHVQPCDAGIIRTLKALYRSAFCSRAIQLDEAGAENIYKIDLREAMLLAVEAWDKVKPSTIINCWNHTRIQPDQLDVGPTAQPALQSASATQQTIKTRKPTENAAAWVLIREFTMSDEIRLPQVEDQLHDLLGASFVLADWTPILKVIMDAENDTKKALSGLNQLTIPIFGCPINELSAAHTSQIRLGVQDPAPLKTLVALPSSLPQLANAEETLSVTVNDLKKRKRIIGKPLTLDEMLNPVEEQIIGDSDYRFEGGDQEIVAKVKDEMAVRRGEVIDVDEEPEDEDDEPEIELCEAIRLCEMMEHVSIKYGSAEASLNLARGVRKLRIELRQMETARLKQTTLDCWVGKNAVTVVTP